jgi:hypothetical protein
MRVIQTSPPYPAAIYSSFSQRIPIFKEGAVVKKYLGEM